MKIEVQRVYRNPGESDEQYKDRQKEAVARAVKKFKKIIDKCGILKEVQEKRYYSKPSEVRRLDKKRGIMNWKKKERKLNEATTRSDKR